MLTYFSIDTNREPSQPFLDYVDKLEAQMHLITRKINEIIDQINSIEILKMDLNDFYKVSNVTNIPDSSSK